MEFCYSKDLTINLRLEIYYIKKYLDKEVVRIQSNNCGLQKDYIDPKQGFVWHAITHLSSHKVSDNFQGNHQDWSDFKALIPNYNDIYTFLFQFPSLIPNENTTITTRKPKSVQISRPFPASASSYDTSQLRPSDRRVSLFNNMAIVANTRIYPANCSRYNSSFLAAWGARGAGAIPRLFACYPSRTNLFLHRKSVRLIGLSYIWFIIK